MRYQKDEAPRGLTSKGWGTFMLWWLKAALFHCTPNFCSFYGDGVHFPWFNKLLLYVNNK